MSIKLSMTGFEEADKQLERVRITMRGKVLTRALNRVMHTVVKEAASRIPAEGRTIGGMDYTPRTGPRASRTPLAQAVGQVMRTYRGGDVLVAVGGPTRGPAARHAHLIEKGFWHTTGGTFAGSGGRTRKAGRYFFTDVTKQYETGPVTFKQWKKIDHKKRTGKGKRGAFIFPRPFLLYTFARMQPRLVQMVADEIRTYADKRKW